ncbi:DUF3613 domain-containing protein [Zobellella aerophila]|uniref:DUF3613 domain-containing protein n=1 Tax=Zobellella aerophila TaxID=870480 RepID=A0ABP6VUL5_9GAMM
MNKKRLISLVLLLSTPGMASANNSQIPGLGAEHKGLQTGIWLQLQREGQVASEHIQTVTPAERELIMKRWLESYRHPVPEFYDQEAAGTFTP